MSEGRSKGKHLRLIVCDDLPPEPLDPDIKVATCERCNGSAFISARIAPVKVADRTKAGYAALVCVYCLADGNVEFLT